MAAIMNGSRPQARSVQPSVQCRGKAGPSRGGSSVGPVLPRGPSGAVVEAPEIVVDGVRWQRILIRTHVIQPGEDIVALAVRYTRPYLRTGDWFFVGQKAVSISQGRMKQARTVTPRALAYALARCVRRTPYGFGLGKPETMEMAIREVGTPRILLAAAVGALGRAVGRSGDFYRVAGRRVAAIDGATEWAQPPFNEYIVLHPDDADGLVKRLAEALGIAAAIVDLNDLGGAVLAASPGLDVRRCIRVLADNPLGQGAFCTPLGLARRIDGVTVGCASGLRAAARKAGKQGG
jgi:hypothetical protein